MALFEDTNPRELKELLSQIHQGDAVLPDFQRSFVWDPSAIRELIISIANNYPAGSLLRIRNSRNLFAYRNFEGAPEIQDQTPTYLILDGQQRLTSLYQAFFGVGEYRFYIKMRTLHEIDDFDDACFYLKSSHKRVKLLEDEKVQAETMIMPLGVLEGGAGHFGRWSKKMVRLLKLSNEERIRLEDQLIDIEEGWIRAIDDYKLPVVTLSDKTKADAVCTIFETLNRTGVQLSPFELLTARFWPHGINLRQLWDIAISEHPIIEDYEVDPYYLLQVIALICRKTPSCKRSDVLNLSVQDIGAYWQNAVDAMETTLRILRDDCGVVIPKWLPYSTIIIPFAGILAMRPLPKGPEATDQRQKMTRWYWCSVFSQAYDNAANSQSAKDMSEVVEWIDGGDPPDTIANFVFDPGLFAQTTYRQRAMYRGTIGLILRDGARDFHKNEPITGSLIHERRIDDHHIFPDNFLKTKCPDITKEQRNCVLNRTLIDRTTNQIISDRAPTNYMARMRDAMEEEQLVAILESHLIRSDSEAAIWVDDFDGFLSERQQLLLGEVSKVTGWKP